MADLSTYLVSKGVVGFLAMDTAVQHMRKVGGRLTSSILDTTDISPDDLLAATAEAYGIGYASDTVLANVDGDAFEFWHQDKAFRLGALPLAIEPVGVAIGVLEPLSEAQLDEIKEEYGHNLTQLLMLEFRFFELCHRFYKTARDARYARWSQKHPLRATPHPVHDDDFDPFAAIREGDARKHEPFVASKPAAKSLLTEAEAAALADDAPAADAPAAEGFAPFDAPLDVLGWAETPAPKAETPEAVRFAHPEISDERAHTTGTSPTVDPREHTTGTSPAVDPREDTTGTSLTVEDDEELERFFSEDTTDPRPDHAPEDREAGSGELQVRPETTAPQPLEESVSPSEEYSEEDGGPSIPFLSAESALRHDGLDPPQASRRRPSMSIEPIPAPDSRGDSGLHARRFPSMGIEPLPSVAATESSGLHARRYASIGMEPLAASDLRTDGSGLLAPLSEDVESIPLPTPQLSRNLRLSDSKGDWSHANERFEALSREGATKVEAISLTELRAVYQGARDVHQILHATLSYLAPHYARRFVIHFWSPRRSRGLLMQGVEGNSSPFTNVEIPYDGSSTVFKARQSRHYLQGGPVEVGFQTLYSRLGIAKSPEIIGLPIVLQDQVVMMLLMDNGPDKPLDASISVGEVTQVLQQLSIALAQLADRNRIARSERGNSPTPVDGTPALKESSGLLQPDGTTSAPRLVSRTFSPEELVGEDLLDSAPLPDAPTSGLEAAMDTAEGSAKRPKAITAPNIDSVEHLFQTGPHTQTDDAPRDDEGSKSSPVIPTVTADSGSLEIEIRPGDELSPEVKALLEQDTIHNDLRAVAIIVSDDERDDDDIAYDLIPPTEAELRQRGEPPAPPKRSETTEGSGARSVIADTARQYVIQADEPDTPAKPRQNYPTPPSGTRRLPPVADTPVSDADKSPAPAEELSPAAARRAAIIAAKKKQSWKPQALAALLGVDGDTAEQTPDPKVGDTAEQSADATVGDTAEQAPDPKVGDTAEQSADATIGDTAEQSADATVGDTAEQSAVELSPAEEAHDGQSGTQEQSADAPGPSITERLTSVLSGQRPNDAPTPAPREDANQEQLLTPGPREDDILTPAPREDDILTPSPREDSGETDAPDTMLFFQDDLQVLRSDAPTPPPPSDTHAASDDGEEGDADDDKGQKRITAKHRIRPIIDPEEDAPPSSGDTSPQKTRLRAARAHAGRTKPAAGATSGRHDVLISPEPSPSAEPSSTSATTGRRNTQTVIVGSIPATQDSGQFPIAAPATAAPADALGPLDDVLDEVSSNAPANLSEADAAQLIAEATTADAPEESAATPPPAPKGDAKSADAPEARRVITKSSAKPGATLQTLDELTESQRRLDTTAVDPVTLGDPLLEQLLAGDDAQRLEAIEELSERPVDQLPSIISLFPGPLDIDRHDDERVHRPVAEHGPLLALIDRRPQGFLPQIWACLERRSADARYYALRFLSLIRDLELRYALIEAVFDEDDQVRQLAIRLIDAHRANPDFALALDTFRARTRAEEPIHRAAAIMALVYLNDTQSIPRFIELLEDEEPGIGERAREGLMRMTFIDHGPTPDAWLEWHQLHGREAPEQWLVDAMDAMEPLRRELAARALRKVPGLVVNYHPEMSPQGLTRARLTVERFFQLRRG